MPKEKKPRMKFGAIYQPFANGGKKEKFKISQALSEKLEEIRARHRKV